MFQRTRYLAKRYL